MGSLLRTRTESHREGRARASQSPLWPGSAPPPPFLSSLPLALRRPLARHLGTAAMPSTRLATAADAAVVTELVNTAFIEGDAFFKVPEYFKRLDDAGRGAAAVIASDDQAFLLLEADSDARTGAPARPAVLGCVKAEFPPAPATAEERAAAPAVTVHFGMMSVPARNGGRGAGTALLAGLEALFAARYPAAAAAGGITVEMPLISVREDLFRWYGKRGYAAKGGLQELPAELAPMLSPEYEGKVKFQYYTKTLPPIPPGAAGAGEQ